MLFAGYNIVPIWKRCFAKEIICKEAEVELRALHFPGYSTRPFFSAFLSVIY